jgi:hypothetical protein
LHTPIPRIEFLASTERKEVIALPNPFVDFLEELIPVDSVIADVDVI